MDPDEAQGALDRNKTLVIRFVDSLINQRNSAAIDEFLAPDFIDHNAPPEQPRGAEGVKRVLEHVMTVLADLRSEVIDVIAEGDKVVLHHKSQARHVGNFMGFPATGKILTWHTISIYRIRAGKIAERWGLIDHANLLRQMRDLDVKRSV
jgi:steroid delta-isomerase-like uncharacterized protein